MTATKDRSPQELEEIFAAGAARQGRWLRDYLAGPPLQAKQFDFLIGSWDTVQVGYDMTGKEAFRGVGTWSAETLYEGRMLADFYETRLPDGRIVSGGRTLRTFCPETDRWEMTFLTPMQPHVATRFVARECDGEIHAEASGVDADGVEFLARVRFFDIEPAGFEWEHEQSWDAGRSWYRLMTISARRRPAEAR